MGGKISSPVVSRSFFSSSTDKHPVPDPRLYTDGRWLHQDELQRKVRYIEFDFPQLCKIAISLCEAASEVTSYEKKEGGYNRVFILTMDTGKRIVVRIPTSVAGPRRLTTNSEVATIMYLQSKTLLPLPKILAWSDNPANPTGTEYIIQEHIEGIQLHEQWPTMDSVQHMECTKTLALIVRDMVKLDFPAYGNIYFSDAPIDEHLKLPLEDGFCIGPYCSPLFWNCGPGELELYGKPSSNKGPWINLDNYATGLIDTAFSRLPDECAASTDHLPFRGSVESHSRLLKICHKMMQALNRDERIQKAASPTLIHADYNKRNIYVSPDDSTIITGIIDWQLTCIEPAFIYAQTTSDFAALPDIDPSREVNEPKSKDEERLLKDIAICHRTYDVILTYKTTKLRLGRELNSSLFRLFHYCYNTWQNGIPTLRQDMIDLKAMWPENIGECPYSPTEQELSEHAKQYEDFETRQKLKMWLKLSMDTTSDGWFPNELWADAKKANRIAYDEWIQSAREFDDMTVEKADSLWPFDAR
ncbi:hypothetical protein FQN57_001799 [Myotisia sp. PD_48]|nr:hypothetical protein FQN57_001799 [Myotisia sp. PD_48]